MGRVPVLAAHERQIMAYDYFIREATPDDAEGMIAFMKVIADEPDNNITYSSAAEFTYTVEEERELVRYHQMAENCLWILAVTPEDEIIGSANVTGGRRVLFHTVSVGISVAQTWRNRGVGTSMMQFIVHWCSANPVVHRLELNVFTHNARAIHVYEKLGFAHEGVRKQAYFKDGRFIDAHVMAICFDHP
jgi:RimJ/RimL family protein N-acetyltransferase